MQVPTRNIHFLWQHHGIKMGQLTCKLGRMFRLNARFAAGPKKAL
jgi:hypothetical protein